MRKKNELQEFTISYELTKTIKQRKERDDDFTIALMDCQVKTLYIRFTRFSIRILLKVLSWSMCMVAKWKFFSKEGCERKWVNVLFDTVDIRLQFQS